MIVVCNDPNCTARCTVYTGSTKRLEKHLQQHHQTSNPTFGKHLPKAEPDQQSQFKYYILMFIITAGLSYRAVENKYFVKNF